MSAFASPTINDFLDQLKVQTDRVVRDFQDRKNEISSMCAKTGTTQSSTHILLLLRAIDEHAERGVALLLGELRRALSYPELDPRVLRDLIPPRLDELADRIITAAAFHNLIRSLQSNQVDEMVSTKIEDIRLKIRFWLRQFDIGWDQPVTPEPLPTAPKNH
jgi:hypothetical protein